RERLGVVPRLVSVRLGGRGDRPDRPGTEQEQGGARRRLGPQPVALPLGLSPHADSGLPRHLQRLPDRQDAGTVTVGRAGLLRKALTQQVGFPGNHRPSGETSPRQDLWSGKEPDRGAVSADFFRNSLPNRRVRGLGTHNNAAATKSLTPTTFRA